MKKTLTIITILMVAIAGKARTLEDEITDFPTECQDKEIYTETYVENGLRVGEFHERYCDFYVGDADTPDPPEFSFNGTELVCKYINSNILKVCAQEGYKLKKVVITFDNKEHSPANSVNGFDTSNSTLGVEVGENTVSYSGEFYNLKLKFNTTDGRDHYLYIKSFYAELEEDTDGYLNVSTAEQFYNAITTDYASASIRLTNDIDLSSLSFSGGTVFTDIPFCGRITGENPGGTDYSISGIGDYKGSMLFSTVTGATFSHLILENFKHYNSDGEKRAILTARSENSTYQYITIRNSGVYDRDKDGSNERSITESAGLIAISNGDNISNCTVESSCSFIGSSTLWSDVNMGGIVAKAYNTVFTCCHNAAYVYGNENQLGGIVAYAEGCTIDRCLNSGHVSGDENTGGIVGNAAKATVIKRCVNIGLIDQYEDATNDRRGGIAGLLQDDGSSVVQCLNFGTVNHARNEYGEIVGGLESGATEWNNASSHCFYYCQYNGDHKDNESTYTDENSIYRYAKMTSGEFAFKSTADEVSGANKWLYQDIDNNTYCTHLPVPIPDAGTVYSNILCDGTQSYSNIYKSTSAHTSVADQQGYCTICGSRVIIGTVHIQTANELCEFAQTVNSGTDYNNSTIYLDNDIDMSGVTDYVPIGTLEHPFMGTFDGQSHRIKNLSVSLTENYAGLFGSVAGDATIIKNLVIDSSCSVTSTASAVGGIVGGVNPTNSNVETCKVTIENCGNEASVTATSDAGGIIGGVYANDNAVLEITNCYNTGAVKSTNNQAASLCGYARKNYTFTNCYNSGTLTGVDGTKYFYRYKDGGTTSVTNCYDVNGAQVTKITADQVKSGELCFMLNGNKAAGTWGQTSADAFPVLSGTGMQHHSRTMTNRWGTICLPFDTKAKTDYNFYSIQSINSKVITLCEMEEVPAGTPVVIHRGSESTTIDIVCEEGTEFADKPVDVNPVNGVTLTGSFTTEDITDEDGYIIANNAFWKIADIKGSNKVHCTPFRAWLKGTIASGARTLTFEGFDDVSTSLDMISSPFEELEGGTIYNLSGHRLFDLQKGVNIIKFTNGATKKVIIK